MTLKIILKGGPGSGYRGHTGSPGRGGSLPRGAGSAGDSLVIGMPVDAASVIMKQHTATTAKEVGALFTRDGKLIRSHEGSENSVLVVPFARDGIDLLHIHTHPPSQSGRMLTPPSRNDINMIYQHKSLAEMRIHTAANSTWVITRNVGAIHNLSGYAVKSAVRNAFDDLALSDDAPTMFSDEWYITGNRAAADVLGLTIELRSDV